ncbi:hypothetical protein [Thermaerobacter litoralis]
MAEGEQPARRRVTFFLPPDLVRALRVEAARNDEYLSETVERLLRRALAESAQAQGEGGEGEDA